MANSLGELLGFTNSPMQKIQKEINGMEEKKILLISAVEQDVLMLKQKIDIALLEIGAKVYTCHIDSTDLGESLSGLFADVTLLEHMVAEKEDKIKEIANRYDEEIGMLRTHLPKPDLPPMLVPQPTTNYLPAPDGVTMAFCENCGTPYVQGEDYFCMSCGQKLS